MKIRRNLLLAALALSPLVFSNLGYSLGCGDLLGEWKGNLGGQETVTLTIHQPDGMEAAVIDFQSQDGGYSEYGLLSELCMQSDDGASVHLTRDMYGVNADIYAMLTSDHSLVVSSMSVQDFRNIYTGSGTLFKS